MVIYSLWLAVVFGLLAFVVVHDAGVVPSGPIWPLAVLAMSALVAERQSVRLSAALPFGVNDGFRPCQLGPSRQTFCDEAS